MGVIAGGLLGLIALLATLQYRWLGQISGAERDRMRVTLNAQASGFGDDVDREVTRAYLLFQLDAMQADQGTASRIAARYDRWQATAKFPRMIKDLYVLSSNGAGPASLQRFNGTTRFLEPAQWPEALVPVQKSIERAAIPAQPNPSASSAVLLRPVVPTVWGSIPALVISAPVLMVSHLEVRGGSSLPATSMTSGLRYTIAQLDGDFIRNEMLPALAKHHFKGTGDGFDYQIAVVPTAAGTTGAVYHSTASFTPAANANNVDARVDVFQVRPKDFDALVSEVSRFMTFTALARGGEAQRSHTIVREIASGARGDVTMPAPPVSIVVQTQSPGNAATQQRVGAMLSGAATAFSTRVSAPSPAQWRLLVQHPSGSLERAVNAARRRNMIISSSILGILGVSVGFLVLSTRRAHDLARQQLEFVATVSHELRTPLAVIRSAADNLADGVVNDEARIRQYGQLVRREGLRLTDLVEQILEFAGLQSGQRKLTPKPVAIAPLLRDVRTTAEATAPAGVEIEWTVADDLPAVAGDEAALRRVFQNLVGNAMKYGADGRWIGIRAAASGGGVQVSVSDRGIGIAPSDQSKIFDPFYRAPDVVAAQIHGAGLGLSLVKRIVEAHGGEISVVSAPGAGSTFTVTLPVMEGDAADGRDPVGDTAPQPL
jgi:signal transduction histidine kinase